MLAAKNISRTFNGGKAGFENISFTIEQGEIIGILGTSGCGKSTLLRVLSGLDDGYKGSFTLENGKVGMMFQEPRLMPWLSVQDNVSFGVKGEKAVKERRNC
ncbi:ATP-binding cassette domain-containing protein [Bacillus sp. N9]